MPSIKRTGIKAEETKTGFEAYDGPEPKRRGFYRAKTVTTKYKKFRPNAAGEQNEGLVVSVVLEAAKGDPKGHKQFDGYPVTTNIVFGSANSMIAREQNFYAALGVVGVDPAIVFEKGDAEKGIKVTKIGTKNPDGQVVNVDLKPSTDEAYPRPDIDGIYKFKETGVFKDETAEDEDDEADEADETEEDETEEASEDEFAERQAELEKSNLAELRTIAKEAEIATEGLKKAQLVEAILAWEFEEESDEDEEAEDEEEDDVEVDDEEEEEEEDEEEEDDESERNARAAELATFDRAALKKIIRGLVSDYSVKTSTTDEKLVEDILEAEFSSTPF